MVNPSTPFYGTDFTKIFSDFRVPGVDMQALMATQRRNLEAVNHRPPECQANYRTATESLPK